ncbi:MAG: glucose/galactose MFS transporter [Proteobacteria bacterium]|nr:glucose/galactose MFS transporter [Pseudomonadota bacterium]
MDRLRGLGISGAFVAVTTVFFAWGFIASNNDPLIVAVRAAFQLNYTEALAVQLISFLAYGLVSLPAASLGNRLGAFSTLVIALGIMLTGCVAVRLSLRFDSFAAILAALFVLAMGITTLQVSANPLAAALGPPRTSHFRLNLAQAFNSLGVVVGVNFGASVMLGEQVMRAGQGQVSGPEQRAAVLQAVGHAFTLIAVVLAVLMAFLWSQRRRIIAASVVAADPGRQASVLDALRSRWAIFGAVAIGLYVGAEVSIGSIMINFLHQDSVLGLPLEKGARYLANLYWGGALAGRVVGSVLLTRVPAARLLGFCAAVAASLCALALADAGAVSGYAALAVGLFNSIMFPTIFTLTLERSGASQSATSGLLCLAIAGGAALPFLVGRIADTANLALAFAVPAAAYLVITCFALRSAREAEQSMA